MRRGVAAGLFQLLVWLPLNIALGQDHDEQTKPLTSALSAPVLDHMLAAYREEAKAVVTASEEDQQRWLKLSDEDLTVAVIRQLSRTPEGTTFLLGQLEKDSSGKMRSAIIGSLGSYWRSHPQSQTILEQHVSSDPDPKVSLQSLELLRSMRMTSLRQLLEARIEAAASSGDTDAKAQLGREEEVWFSLENKTMLPSFLRQPPPVFSIKPADQAIRVLAFGDFGTGSPAQRETAAAMVEYHKKYPFDFGLTLGDNFYTYGMTSPSDPRWQTQWEQLYGPLGIKFYATLGNHDWASADSPAAEILYTNQSPDWRLPAPYYTFTAGPVQFFAFDTVEVNEAELEWLDSELAKSTAPWKLVYGHYHIYSATRGDNKELIERLLPVLKKNGVDVYLNGHDHNLQELKPEGTLHFFVSGGGGAGLYNLNPYDRSVYKQKVNGFTVLEADQKRLKVSFVGNDGKELYQNTLTKEP